MPLNDKNSKELSPLWSKDGVSSSQERRGNPPDKYNIRKSGLLESNFSRDPKYTGEQRDRFAKKAGHKKHQEWLEKQKTYIFDLKMDGDEELKKILNDIEKNPGRKPVDKTHEEHLIMKQLAAIKTYDYEQKNPIVEQKAVAPRMFTKHDQEQTKLQQDVEKAVRGAVDGLVKPFEDASSAIHKEVNENVASASKAAEPVNKQVLNAAGWTLAGGLLLHSLLTKAPKEEAGKEKKSKAVSQKEPQAAVAKNAVSVKESRLPQAGRKFGSPIEDSKKGLRDSMRSEELHTARLARQELNGIGR